MNIRITHYLNKLYGLNNFKNLNSYPTYNIYLFNFLFTITYNIYLNQVLLIKQIT